MQGRVIRWVEGWFARLRTESFIFMPLKKQVEIGMCLYRETLFQDLVFKEGIPELIWKFK